MYLAAGILHTSIFSYIHGLPRLHLLRWQLNAHFHAQTSRYLTTLSSQVVESDELDPTVGMSDTVGCTKSPNQETKGQSGSVFVKGSFLS